jgi:hypothetical protein
MGDVVDLHGQSTPTRDDLEFVTDLARFAENLVSEADIKRKYRFGNEVWDKLGDDDELVRAIESERLRRVRNGDCKRERAQQLITKAPTILDGIMSDPNASPRHRVDAIKTLDTFAANGPQGAPASDRFSIVINLGSDIDGKPIVEKYDRSIAIDVNDVDHHHPDAAPQGPWPIIAANRRKDDGGNGEPV